MNTKQDASSAFAKLARAASMMDVGGFRPPTDPLTSWMGRVLVSRAGECWPMTNTNPMMPLCQLNVTEAPFVPASLSDVALLTVFVDPDCGTFGANGDGWLLRTYASLDGLVPIETPSHEWGSRAFPIGWRHAVKDFPCWEDVPRDVADLLLAAGDHGDDIRETDMPNLSGSKLGGWPTLIQSEIYWAPYNRHPASPEYVFQIDSEPKCHIQWGDGGVAYFGRGTGEHSDTWVLETQCM